MSILDFFSDMDGEPDDSKRALRFRDIWARSTVAMALSDANGIILDANPAYYRLFGYEPSEVLFHSFAIIFPPEQRAWAEARYHEMFQRTGPESVVETFARHKDGTER